MDKQNHYLGVITSRKLMYTIAKSVTIQSDGGVIVLEMNNNDYSLTEIASIVESNNTKILSSYIISTPNSTNIEVTIKLNKKVSVVAITLQVRALIIDLNLLTEVVLCQLNLFQILS